MKQIRSRALPFAATLALVAGAVSALGTGVTAVAAYAAPPATASPAASKAGNEASVPARPLAVPAAQQAEPSAGPLPAPRWPAASDTTVTLAATGARTAGAAASGLVTAGPVVSVGAVAPPPGARTAAGPTASPASVRVRVLPRAAVAAAGGQGLGIVLDRTDGGATAAPVRVSVDYSGFAGAYGGDYGARLRLVSLPACALTTPQAPGCDTPTFIADAVNDPLAHTVTGTVPANPDARVTTGAMAGTVVTLDDTSSSGGGDYRATDLSPTGSWSAGTASGDFTYSVPIDVPPAPYGPSPDLSLDYDSGSVDGMTSGTNNQASQVGLGWSLTSSYVERRYRVCAADGQAADVGDLCWYSPGGTADPTGADYVISLDGKTSNLVPDPANPGQFRLTDDPGWVAIHHGSPTSSATATTSSEYWTVLTPDGTIYYLGIGVDAKDGTTPTNSVLTEPVFGNDTGEPCNNNWADTAHQTDRKACTQAWRWMLDRVSDPNEVKTTYTYQIETNSYRSIEGPNESRSYDMGADLTQIEYGYASQLGGGYTDTVALAYVGRCTDRMSDPDPLRDTVADCPSISGTPADYPDVPTDKICSDPTGDATGCEGGDLYSPVYFSTQMLWDIHTYLGAGTGGSVVEQYQLKHALQNPPGAGGATLWFDYLQRETYYNGTDIVLPVLNFNAEDLDNVVGGTDLEWPRIQYVYTDTGSQITVTYGHGGTAGADACTTTDLPDPAHNDPTQGGMDCYRTQWIPEGATSPQTGWFKKWVVTEVDVDPRYGTGAAHDGDPTQVTTYAYPTGGAGWKFPDDPDTQLSDQGWTQWEGYDQVTVSQGPDDGSSTYDNATVYWVYQGLDGDRTNTSGSSTKTVTVSGSSAGPTLSLPNSNHDSVYFAGRVYEESHRDNTGLAQEYVVHNYGFIDDTANYVGLPDARFVGEDKTLTYDYTSTASHPDLSTWRESEIQHVYDTSVNATKDFGLPTEVENDGQIGVSTDNTCTALGYAYNIDPASARWMALQNQVTHYNATCANASAANQDGLTRTSFDGTAFGTAPVDGNATEIDSYTTATAFTSVKHTYDTAGRTLSTTDGNGNVSTTVYTPTTGWPTGGVATTTPTPDIAGHDYNGHTGATTPLTSTAYTEPGHGLTTKTVDASGDTTTMAYDTEGRLTSVTEPKDQAAGTATATYAYTVPTGTSSTGVPDAVNGPPEVAARSLQSGTTYLSSYTYYDGMGQVREVQTPAADGSPGRDVVSTRYDPSGFVEGTSAPYYNSGAPGSGMVNPAVSALPSYTDLIVDWQGRTTESRLMTLGTTIAANDTRTVFWPDRTTVTDPDGNVTVTVFDVFGKTTAVTQQTPHSSPTSITTSYGYDDQQRLTSVSDAASDRTAYTFNWAGEQTAATDPDGGYTCTYYDANNNAQYTVAAAPATCPADPTTLAGRITTVYDALNRPTSTWQGAAGTGTELTSTTYDTATLGKGREASSTSYSGGSAYTETTDGYDADGNGLGTTVTIPSSAGFGTTSFDTTATFDSDGHQVTTGYPAAGTGSAALSAETVTTTYGSTGQPVSLAGTLGSYVSGTTFTNWGPVQSRGYAGPVATLTATRTYAWDQATGWLTGIKTTVTNNGTATTAQNDTYGYDNAHNLREIASAAGTAQQQCFAYDDLNRLTGAYTATAAAVPATAVANCGSAAANHTGGVGPYDLAYGYNQLGNVTSVVDSVAGTTATYSYPPAGSATPDQPHAVTGVQHKVTATGVVTGTDTYGYDTAGDMNARTVAGTAATLGWTPQLRLASVTAGAATTGYVYDADGNLLLRKSGTGSTLYLPGEELNLSGSTVTPTRYYTIGGATVAMRVGGTSSVLTWLTADGQGSTQVAVNASTGAYTQQRYLPYGAARGGQAPPAGTQDGYLGRAYDPATGLVQDGARFYDPGLARFLSPDPAVTVTDPQDLNAYSYSLDSPATLSDPTGLYPLGPGGTPTCPSGDPDHCSVSSGSGSGKSGKSSGKDKPEDGHHSKGGRGSGKGSGADPVEESGGGPCNETCQVANMLAAVFTPVAATPPVAQPSCDLISIFGHCFRRPDYITVDSSGFTDFWLGAGTQITLTRTGRVYLAPQGGVGSPGGATMIRAGWIGGPTSPRPSNAAITSFVHHTSITGSAQAEAVGPILVGAGVTNGQVGQFNQNAFAFEAGVGLGEPGGGVTGSYSVHIFNLPLHW